VSRLVTLIKTLFTRKEIRFLFVGGVNTVVGYGAYAICLLLGLHYALAQLISTVIGATNSYMWNKYFTFRQSKKSAKEVVRFVSVYAVSYALNYGLLKLMIDVVGLNEYIAGAIGLVVTTLVSWFGHNYFSFKRRNDV
jgi:putative flippase GtrA